MQNLRFWGKLAKLSLKNEWVKATDIGKSYDKVSTYYDDYFLKIMHQHNETMLCDLPDLKGVIQILDLACGTGFNCSYLHARYANAVFHLTDLSEGMLRVAREKCPFAAEFAHKDMLSYLKEQEDERFDLAVCSWAIKYQEPKKIIHEIKRVLKPGGIFGVIVNKKDTLPEIRRIFVDLLSENASAIQKIMPELPNPKGKTQFIRWFTERKFTCLSSGEGKQLFNFRDPKDLIRWVTRTGALAGFDQMMDLGEPQVRESMLSLFRAKQIQTVTHTFVYGVFKKGDRPC